MIQTISEFLELVASSDPESLERIRTEIAPESLWLELIVKHPDCVRAITLNRHLPTQVLDVLAANEDASVRTDVANRRALPLQLFKKLSADVDESVRARVAWNKKVPKDILAELAQDESPIVFEVARRRLAELK